MSDLLNRTIDAITPVDESARAAAEAHQARLIKPVGALGKVEMVGNQLAAIAGCCPPPYPSMPVVVLFAADHGVCARQISPWKQEITVTMAAAQARGVAGSSVLAAEMGAAMRVVDVGVAGDTSASPAIEQRTVRPGTGDITREAAMTRDECTAALEVGIDVALDAIDRGCNLLLLGEMGIGNTTTAAALIAARTGVRKVAGRGAGAGDAMLARKQRAIDDALARVADRHLAGLDVMTELGGLEIAAMSGAMLAAASRRVPVVVDGVIACAAALVAVDLAPDVVGYLIASHLGCEPGIRAALGTLGLTALVDLDLRLGEATGALMALPAIRAGARILTDMATFDAAGVDDTFRED